MKLFALTALLFIMHGVKCHGTKYFMCQDGSLTNATQVCDGVHDCPDGFDENREICARTKCSPNMFRCLYGACISKSARCDGKYQCLDKSDEFFCKQHIKTCTTNEFQCLTEECIPKNKVCDGIDDCLDKSDERIDYCNGILCPKNTYHCKYGGCIDLDARCNGFRDCVDGSDESELLCKSLKCSKKECIKAYNKIACPPIISSRIIVKCKSDKKMHKGWLSCNKNVPTGTIAEYRCKPYYHPINYYHANNTYAICQPDGTWSREHLQCEPDCGKAEPVVAPLVVYGWSTEKGMWPWHATLYTLQEGNWKFWCGGSLISEKVIITAAHCTWTVTPDTMKAALGKYYVNFNSTQVFTQIIDVQNIIIQPLYQDVLGNYGSDIAIIILSKMVNFSPYVSPVCVDWELHDITEHLSNDSIGMIAGMGITEKDTFSKNLRATSLPVVSDEKCIESQASDFKKYITYTSFCAGWANGTGVCNGDSGGGLVFRKTTDVSVWVLQGVVSVSPRRLGTLFCDPSHYTIFTKVGMYVDWIKNELKKVHFVDILSDTTVENIAL